MADSDFGPQDPIGTVRAGDDMIAVRCLLPDAASTTDLGWYVFDVAEAIPPVEVDAQQVLATLHTWPIVYQPPTDKAAA